jgi:pilus assembly protein CpaC
MKIRRTPMNFHAQRTILAAACCSLFATGSGAAWSKEPVVSRPAAAQLDQTTSGDTGGDPVQSAPGIQERTDSQSFMIDAAAPAREFEMFVGESRVFATPGVARIAVGSGQVITANALDAKDVIIFANGAGTTMLYVWTNDGRYQRIKVTVMANDVARYAREVASFLSTIPKTKATVVGDKVIVEGDDLSDADRDKVAELAKRYPQIVNFTGQIGWEQTVLMDVKVVEFPRSQLRELGLKWGAAGGAAVGGIWRPVARGDTTGLSISPPAGDAGALPVASTSPNGLVYPSGPIITSAVNLGLNAQLQALEQSGTATVLAEPQLSTRSGYKATFHAGGEIPYSVASVNGVTVQFKPYGIRLDIEPRVARSGAIRAVIDSEVSSIDSSVSTTNGPALLTRRTRTEFNVKPGETIVLAGLLQRTNSTDTENIPFLGNIPILGALFRSKRFQNKETELVVLVTPHLVDSNTPALKERIKRVHERLKQNLGDAPYLSDPLQPSHATEPAN